jgi:hypothetical protein
LVENGETLRGVALRLVAKFAGEVLSEAEVKAILEEGAAESEERRTSPARVTANLVNEGTVDPCRGRVGEGYRGGTNGA